MGGRVAYEACVSGRKVWASLAFSETLDRLDTAFRAALDL